MHNYLTKVLSLLIITAALSLYGCKKYVRNGDMDGGIVLTFDDNYIDDWYKYLPVLDSFGAKATFYVSHYPYLSKEQKHKLKIIQLRGHEIAFHTTNHANLANMIKTKSLAQVMQKEVKIGLDSMHKDGFYPMNFAYPYGTHNEILDAAMLSVFKSVRLLNGTQDYSKSVCCSKGKTYFRSLNIDEEGVSQTVIEKMLLSAKDHNNAVVFLAHKINSPPRLSISPKRLVRVLTRAKELGLKFYKVEDLCR